MIVKLGTSAMCSTLSSHRSHIYYISTVVVHMCDMYVLYMHLCAATLEELCSVREAARPLTPMFHLRVHLTKQAS
jgi:hypothetical protein